MIEAAESSGIRLCVVHNMLFLPMITKAKRMIEKGLIGDLVGINITDNMSTSNDLMRNKGHWCHKLPGGVFGEMLPHPIYLAAAFLGRLEVAMVYSKKLNDNESIAANELRVVLQNENSVATITASVSGPSETMALDILGTKASLYVSNGIVVRHTPIQNSCSSRGLNNIQSASQLLTGTTSATLRAFCGRLKDGHYNFIRKFIVSIQNKTELPVTLEEAREVVRLYEEITSQI